MTKNKRKAKHPHPKGKGCNTTVYFNDTFPGIDLSSQCIQGEHGPATPHAFNVRWIIVGPKKHLPPPMFTKGDPGEWWYA